MRFVCGAFASIFMLLTACGGSDIQYERPDGSRVEINVKASSFVDADARRLDEVVRSRGGVCRDGSLNRRAVSTLEQVLPLFDVRQDIRITCIDRRDPSAFVSGTRDILISRGMIERMTEHGQLEFVIGHELAHLYWAHREKFARLERLADEFLSKELKPVSSNVQARADFLGEANAIRNLFLDMEYKADTLAIRRLSKTSSSPCLGAGLAFIENMSNRFREVHPWMLRAPQEELLRSWLQTGNKSVDRYKVHPFLAQRRANIVEAMKRYCPSQEL